jgi:hypothetical protein
MGYKNADQIPGLLEKTQERLADFSSQYVREPIMRLKRLLWDSADSNGAQEWTTLTSNDDLKPSLLGWDVSSFDVTGGVKYINDLSQNTVKPLVININKIGPMMIDIIKNQQMNACLAVLTPVIFIGYLGWSGSKKGYASYMNNNYYLPIKYTLRSIDRLINSVANGGQRSYSCDGKLYMLVCHLHYYADCFSHEEQMHLQQDLKDLLSFALTYEQKKGVVDRMYRTYTCVQ